MKPHNEKINYDLMLDDFLNTDDFFDFLRSPPLNLSFIEEQEVEKFSNKFDSSISNQLGPSTNPPRPSVCSHNSDTMYSGLLFDDYVNRDGMEIFHSSNGSQVADNKFNSSISYQGGPSSNPPRPSSCSNCLVLREVIHTNEVGTTKLEIHGCIGLITHALLQNQQTNTHANEYQMFDFGNKSIEEVKNFLVQYCNDRKRGGFLLMHDPLSIFHEAISIGLDWAPNLNKYDFFQPPKQTYYHQGGNRMDHRIEPRSPILKAPKISLSEDISAELDIDDFYQPPKKTCNNQEGNQTEQDSQPGKALKISLREQRKRVANLTFRDLEKYFHLPIEEASKKLKVCATVLKRTCRRHGLKRWPYRKIMSLNKKISNLQPKLHSDDVEIRANAKNDIKNLQRQKANACTPS